MKEFKDLIGKTIVDATVKKLAKHDDEGFLELKFSDGTEVLIVGTYGGYTGKSEDEYQTFIKIVEKDVYDLVDKLEEEPHIMGKEDFEERGWNFKFEFEGEMKFEKGDFWKDDGQGAILYVKNNIIKIITTDKGFNQDGPNASFKFNGECETIEEFDIICKMIKLRI